MVIFHVSLDLRGNSAFSSPRFSPLGRQLIKEITLRRASKYVLHHAFRRRDETLFARKDRRKMKNRGNELCVQSKVEIPHSRSERRESNVAGRATVAAVVGAICDFSCD